MKHAIAPAVFCVLALTAGICRSWAAPPQDSTAESTRSKARPRDQDEALLRAIVAEFTRAFNAGDARSIATLFTPEARIVTLTGKSIEGREAIEKVFAASFAESPGQTIEVKTESLRFLGPDAAIEEGIATITTPRAEGGPAVPAEGTRYSAAYLRREGKWLQDSIRDYATVPAEEPSVQGNLKELEWLVGDWIDESDEGEVHTTCRWAENHAFLRRSFQVRIRGRAEMSGTQLIGWDPRLRQIRSWVFDSDGGFSESLWSRDGERWVIKSAGVVKDGRAASATNMLTRVNRDTIRWTSVDRTLGSEVLPNAEEITLVRKPPQPRTARPAIRPAQPGSPKP
jgi:uncharacterized protein (TIGR02246 family)